MNEVSQTVTPIKNMSYNQDDSKYHTTMMDDGNTQVILIAVSIMKNYSAVEDYIKHYKRYLPEGAGIYKTGSVRTHEGMIPLGIIQPNIARFAFTYLK